MYIGTLYDTCLNVTDCEKNKFQSPCFPLLFCKILTILETVPVIKKVFRCEEVLELSHFFFLTKLPFTLTKPFSRSSLFSR